MNILQLGLDVDSFNEEKMNKLSKFISAFELLSKYDGKVINPIMGTGLVDFNESLIETTNLLEQLKTKIADVGKTSVTGTAAKQQNELSLAVKEYAKNADAAATTSAKLAVATSDQAKETMALKLQLSETSRALLEEAKSNNASVQSKQAQKQAAQEYRQEQMRVVETLRALAIEQDKAEKASNLAKKQQAKQLERELKEEELQRVAALKAVAAQEELSRQEKEADAKATLALISDYELLKIALKDQAAAYANLYTSSGKNAPQTKAALAEYSATSGIISDIDKNLNKASGSTKLFGGALSSAFGQLRTLAYILPGIGIAGLFNLGFEAIEKVVQELGILGGAEEKNIRTTKELTDAWLQLTLAYQKAEDEIKKIAATDATGIDTQKNLTDIARARGYNQGVLIQREIEDSKTRVKLADKELEHYYRNDIERLKNSALVNLRLREQKATDVEILEEKIRSEKPDSNAQKELIARRDLLKSELEDVTQTYSQQQKVISEYYSAHAELDKKEQELIKFNSDQQRKFVVETAQSNIAVIIERNQKILSSETSTQNQRLGALRRIEDAERRLADINRINVTGTKDNPNLSATPVDIKIATEKEQDDILKSTIKFNQSVEKVNTEFYQRHITAVVETNKALLDQESIANERIYKNEEKTINERTEAYLKYISLRQQIQQLELQKDVQKGASGPNGKTSLTSEETNTIYAQTASQKANIQADVEKQVYDIVYTSTQKQLKLIIDSNKLYEQSNKDEYAKELTALNNSFVEKKIRYEDYKKGVQLLDNKYRISNLQATVRDDQIEILNLQDFVNKQKDLRSKAYDDMIEAKDRLDNAQSVGNNDLGLKENYDEALGKYNAYNTEVKNSDLELQKSQEKLKDDRLKLAKAEADALEQVYKEHAANRKAIEKGVYTLIKTYIDAEAEARIETLERNQRVVDERYNAEINSIEKSSLSAKDKTALDVQLNQQKIESDKNADVQERKLKHEQAVIDRELTLAHIAWETEQSIMAAYSIPYIDPITATGIAIERGILGGIAAATVLATKIPSFAEGVIGFEGGYARYAEAGPEWIKEPYKSPYLVLNETISYLPKGTDIIPTVSSPEFSVVANNDGWDQTRWLAKQINKSKQEIKNQVNTTVNINLGTEIWKKQILGN